MIRQRIILLYDVQIATAALMSMMYFNFMRLGVYLTTLIWQCSNTFGCKVIDFYEIIALKTNQIADSGILSMFDAYVQADESRTDAITF